MALSLVSRRSSPSQTCNNSISLPRLPTIRFSDYSWPPTSLLLILETEQTAFNYKKQGAEPKKKANNKSSTWEGHSNAYIAGSWIAARGRIIRRHSNLLLRMGPCCCTREEESREIIESLLRCFRLILHILILLSYYLLRIITSCTPYMYVYMHPTCRYVDMHGVYTSSISQNRVPMPLEKVWRYYDVGTVGYLGEIAHDFRIFVVEQWDP